ncbi:MAG: DNA mismatch repair endonuclease MutL [Deltaproteobacteria bacterium]|nr:DNA mismatch repair endonuclease MutL [Deltaproteobacteria bacterium]
MKEQRASDGRVKRLPDEVVNTIAAGEVVERPASVVKELIENSLDAGATEIEVVLEAGGTERITVIDDGCGMGFEDARACLDRHATSKIRDAEGLFALKTLGFRGEALPSIAAVSRFKLVSRLEGAVEGVRVEVEGGELKRHEAAAAAPGTRIDVEELFVSVPARRKFLRRPSTELGHVSETVGRLALAHPEVGFTLRHEGRVLLATPPGADPLERLLAVLGKDARGQLFPFAGEHHDIRVRGHFGAPSLTRRSAGQGIHLFVNGRWVRDRQVGHAIGRAFASLVDRGRSPVAVVFLEIPPEAVDVNVHPQKLEVRFSEGRRVYDAILRVLGPAVAAAPWAGGATRSYALGAEARAGTPAGAGQAYEEHRARVLAALERFGSGRPAAAREGGAPLFEPRPGAGAGEEAAPLPPGSSAAEGFFDNLRVVGQVARSYIVCEGPEGLVVIDQHAAHERLEFERLRQRWKEGSVAVQRLLVPRTLELGVGEMARLEPHLGALEEAGFDASSLGEETLAVRAVPAALADRRIDEVLRDFLDELGEGGEAGAALAIERALDRLLATVACHSVVRAGDPMSREEMEALVVQMDRVPRGANCPHGRPVAFTLSHPELERRFDRR